MLIRPGFHWTTFDLTSQLPPDWHRDVAETAASADVREFPRTPILSREAPEVSHIRRGRVEADRVQEALPWLYQLYRSDFLELARFAWDDKSVETARDALVTRGLAR